MDGIEGNEGKKGGGRTGVRGKIRWGMEEGEKREW